MKGRLCTQRREWNRTDVIQHVYGFDRETIVKVFYAVHEEPDERELERWENTILSHARHKNKFVPEPRHGRYTLPKKLAKLDRTIARNMWRLKKLRKESSVF